MPEQDDVRIRLQELLEQSRESGERFVTDLAEVLESVRDLLGHQLGQVGLATRDDIARLERKIDDLVAVSTAHVDESTSPERPRSSSHGEPAAGTTPAGAA